MLLSLWDWSYRSVLQACCWTLGASPQLNWWTTPLWMVNMILLTHSEHAHLGTSRTHTGQVCHCMKRPLFCSRLACQPAAPGPEVVSWLYSLHLAAVSSCCIAAGLRSMWQHIQSALITWCILIITAESVPVARKEWWYSTIPYQFLTSCVFRISFCSFTVCAQGSHSLVRETNCLAAVRTLGYGWGE